MADAVVLVTNTDNRPLVTDHYRLGGNHVSLHFHEDLARLAPRDPPLGVRAGADGLRLPPPLHLATRGSLAGGSLAPDGKPAILRRAGRGRLGDRLHNLEGACLPPPDVRRLGRACRSAAGA